MKKLIIFLLIVATFGSCTKKEVNPTKDVLPTVPASTVTGKYDLSSLTINKGGDILYGMIKLPTAIGSIKFSGTANLTVNSKGLIDILITTVEGEATTDRVSITGLELRKKNTAYGLYVGDKSAADLDGTNISYYLIEGTNIVKFTAKR